MSAIGTILAGQALDRSIQLDPKDKVDQVAEMVSLETKERGGDPGELLWLLAGELADVRSRIQLIEDAVAKVRLADVKSRGLVRYADVFVRIDQGSTRTILDLDALLGWLDQAQAELGDLDLIPEVWRLDARNLRITTLRTVAERLYHHRVSQLPHVWAQNPGAQDMETYVRTIEDTFVETRRGDAEQKVAEIPIDKAPNYAQRLGHGERVGSFLNTGESVTTTG